jgi:hypothetical protein
MLNQDRKVVAIICFSRPPKNVRRHSNAQNTFYSLDFITRQCSILYVYVVALQIGIDFFL